MEEVNPGMVETSFGYQRYKFSIKVGNSKCSYKVKCVKCSYKRGHWRVISINRGLQ